MIFPLMPKGVEHVLTEISPPPRPGVIFPLMPKGVEHTRAQQKEIAAMQ